MTEEEEAEGEKTGKELGCDVMEIEVGDHHMDDEEMEETTEEEKEEAASEVLEESADCEANTDKSVREGSESAEPADEVVTDAK